MWSYKLSIIYFILTYYTFVFKTYLFNYFYDYHYKSVVNYFIIELEELIESIWLKLGNISWLDDGGKKKRESDWDHKESESEAAKKKKKMVVFLLTRINDGFRVSLRCFLVMILCCRFPQPRWLWFYVLTFAGLC